jgi:uncharacterized coiled-coil protein SlyX
MNNDLEGFGQWRRTVDTRLGTLETRVAEQASLRAQMDQDMSELRVEFRAQRTLLQALHDTQQEHTMVLSEQSAVLNAHSAILSEHSAILNEHSAILNEHSAILNEHSAILNAHSAILGEHSAILGEHSAVLSQHGAQLTALQTGQQRIMAGVDTIREMLDRTLNSGNE